IVASVSWVAWQRPARDSASTTPFTVAEIIDAHVRSLQPGHLTDVASADNHTVKPWFDGKLAFVPPVKNFADEGFPLVGGRLDVLGGQNVAALVYSRRKHVINVFVLPTKEPDTPIHPAGARQGYQWRHWRHQGMEFCAISDVSELCNSGLGLLGDVTAKHGSGPVVADSAKATYCAGLLFTYSFGTSFA
ncbi:MAG: hypothetical protein DMG43_16650, partial [Acidobacteria bacterium]